LFHWETVMKVMSHLKHQSAACLPPFQQYRTYTAGQRDLNGGETASPQQRLAYAQVATRAFVLINRQVGTSVDGYENDYLTYLRGRGLWPLPLMKVGRNDGS
jgi:hypothetical protein